MTVFFDYSLLTDRVLEKKGDKSGILVPPYGRALGDEPPSIVTHGYKMRARNVADTAWVFWVSPNAPDWTGTSAPEAILVSTIVIATQWGDVPTVIEEVPALVPETFNSSGLVTNHGQLAALILVRTLQGTWVANGVITLPASPAQKADVTVKDADGAAATYPIVVQGNGFLIDGQTSITLDVNWAAVRLVFNGSYWSII